MKRPRLLLTTTAKPVYEFIADDVRMLNRHYQLDVQIGSGIAGAVSFFVHATRADVSFCWFGSTYAFFVVLGAKLFGRKSLIMLGGVDTARIDLVDYGIWTSTFKSIMLRRALKMTDAILAVDKSLQSRLEVSSGNSWPNIQVVPTGYDASKWVPDEGIIREGVLCVARVNSPASLYVKGVDLLIAAANKLPHIQFTLIGVDVSIIEAHAFVPPVNMKVVGPTPREQLLREYQMHSVYCQPSRSEGLPNALCEAMLCGCIPVGTNVGGIPTAIGETGFVVADNDLPALCAAITAALEMDGSARMQARQRIADNFTDAQRERRLTEIIDGLAKK